MAPKNTSKTVTKHPSGTSYLDPAYEHVGRIVLHDIRKVLGHILDASVAFVWFEWSFLGPRSDVQVPSSECNFCNMNSFHKVSGFNRS